MIKSFSFKNTLISTFFLGLFSLNKACLGNLECPATLCCVSEVCEPTDVCRSRTNRYYIATACIGAFFLIVSIIYLILNIKQISASVETQKREMDTKLKNEKNPDNPDNHKIN